jgi:hypothetical protein
MSRLSRVSSASTETEGQEFFPPSRHDDSVTLKPKCYVKNVFVCAGCGRLNASERSDALTCSTACRVRAHRSGILKVIRALGGPDNIPPPDVILRANAVKRLRPDLADQIVAGTRTIDDVKTEVYSAFIKLAFECAEAAE